VVPTVAAMRGIVRSANRCEIAIGRTTAMPDEIAPETLAMSNEHAGH
jgi:hypothetical protein